MALCLLVCMGAFASAERPPLVVDEIGILTQDQIVALNERAEALSREYGQDVAILVVNDTGGQDTYDYATQYYEDNNLGQGDEKHGIMLALNLTDREMSMVTTGQSIDVFTDHALEAIDNDIIGHFGDGNHHTGFERFLQNAEACLKQAASGTPFDVDNPAVLYTALQRTNKKIGLILAGAAIVALVGILVMQRGMKTAVKQSTARHYVREGSRQMALSRDFQLYQTSTRTKRVKQESSSSPSGGSTTKTSSSGQTHGGRSSKF